LLGLSFISMQPCGWLQERIVAGHGIQCGFCTPGMVMAMYALLRSNGAPTELQIEHALQGTS